MKASENLYAFVRFLPVIDEARNFLFKEHSLVFSVLRCMVFCASKK